MNKTRKILQGSVLAMFFTVVLAVSTFAATGLDCVGQGKKYPNLSTTKSTEYDIRCGAPFKVGTTTYTLYGKSSADCAQAGSIEADPDSCSSSDLNDVIHWIINTAIFAVGMVAVVMIILGGVNYATSQGDTNKVTKAKNTIMYGIIGLVVALLAFAIVNFILTAIAAN